MESGKYLKTKHPGTGEDVVYVEDSFHGHVDIFSVEDFEEMVRNTEDLTLVVDKDLENTDYDDMGDHVDTMDRYIDESDMEPPVFVAIPPSSFDDYLGVKKEK